MVRFIATNNGSPTTVDAHLLDFKVIGSLIPHPTFGGLVDVIWLASLVGLPMAMLLILVGMRLAKRRRGLAGNEAGISTGGA